MTPETAKVLARCRVLLAGQKAEAGQGGNGQAAGPGALHERIARIREVGARQRQIGGRASANGDGHRSYAQWIARRKAELRAGAAKAAEGPRSGSFERWVAEHKAREQGRAGGAAPAGRSAAAGQSGGADERAHRVKAKVEAIRRAPDVARRRSSAPPERPVLRPDPLRRPDQEPERIRSEMASGSAGPPSSPSMRGDRRPWLEREWDYARSKVAGFFARDGAREREQATTWYERVDAARRSTAENRLYHGLLKPLASGVIDGGVDLYHVARGQLTALRHPVTATKEALRAVGEKAEGLYLILRHPEAVGEALMMKYEEFRRLPETEQNDLVMRMGGRVAFDILTGEAAGAAKVALKARYVKAAEVLGASKASGAAAKGSKTLPVKTPASLELPNRPGYSRAPGKEQSLPAPGVRGRPGGSGGANPGGGNSPAVPSGSERYARVPTRGGASSGGGSSGAGEGPKVSVHAPKGLPGTTAESVADKLQRYLLNAEHPIGGPKAKWFEEALGYTQENAAALARQIVFDPAKAVATELTQHGQKFNQVISIVGANGKTIDVNFGWIRNNDGVVRLVTAIPTKR